MTPHTDIPAWLATQLPAMTALLRRMVDTDSGSYDKPGTDAVGALVEDYLATNGIQVERLPQPTHGDCLRATVPGPDGAQSGGNEGGAVVLMGHRDTVFPKGEAARRPFTIEGTRATGPGVADMKAGLVMNCFVLAAFHKFGGNPAPLVGLFTGDEEIGSPEGRPVIEAEVRGVHAALGETRVRGVHAALGETRVRGVHAALGETPARAVFNSEPGRASGNVVTGRKGGVFSVMRITGKAAHSGGNFQAGISAIEELAQKIIRLHAITDLGRGITLNVGLVSGGQSVNTVAPHAEAQIDLRYVHPADRDDAMARIAAIVAHSHVPGTKAELEIKGEFLPVVQTPNAKRLFDLYVESAASADLKVEGEFTGGCADSGFTAALGIPTICAVGPVGGNAHSPEEWLDLASMVPRAQACARAILNLDQAGL